MTQGLADDKTALRDAATVLLIRRDSADPAVLMGMRGEYAAFMPSKFVFPGGAVDPGDANCELAGSPPEETMRRLMIEPREGSDIAPDLSVCSATPCFGRGSAEAHFISVVA